MNTDHMYTFFLPPLVFEKNLLRLSMPKHVHCNTVKIAKNQTKTNAIATTTKN